MSVECCPFCQQKNRCGINSSGCWCQNEKAPEALIDLLPVKSIDKDCICQACVQGYKQDPNAFKVRLNGKT